MEEKGHKEIRKMLGNEKQIRLRLENQTRRRREVREEKKRETKRNYVKRKV